MTNAFPVFYTGKNETLLVKGWLEDVLLLSGPFITRSLMWKQEQWGLMIKQSSLWFWRNFGSSNLFICLLKNLLPSLWTAGLLETTILLVNTPAESAGTLAGSYSRPQDYMLHQRRGWKNVRLWHKDENVTPLIKFRRKNSLLRAWIADWFGCEIHRGGHGGREEGADKGITLVQLPLFGTLILVSS